MSGEHLDLDRLADLLAGEGSDDDVAHVGSCAGCAGRLEELSVADREVAAELAALPAPPLPADLAERLTAAVDAEPPLEPAPGPAAAAGAAEREEAESSRSAARTVTPFPVETARRRWAPLAAAAALLVLAGTLGAVLVRTSGGDDEPLSAAGSAGGGVADLPTSSTGQDYAAEGALSASLPALLEGGAGQRAAGTAAAPEVDASTGAPDGASAGASAEALTESGTGAGAGDPLARLREPEALASCLAALLPPTEDVRPLALDYAAYGGQPALVVVLPAVDDPQAVDVFVVGEGCRLGDDRTLFFTRLDRPA